MRNKENNISPTHIFDRVVSILEQARNNVIHTINNQIVTAYLLIGREIVEELQDGEERAEYGKQLLENLSKKLTERYGKGFSVPNLRNFRQFYTLFQNRMVEIRYPTGSETTKTQKRHPPGSENLNRESSLWSKNTKRRKI